MRSPFRVGVWGSGGLGSACIREVLRLPELDLVGVFAYSDAKHGVDVGEIVGVDPTGIAATSDRAAFLASGAECVLFVARDIGDFSTDADILELLGAGMNVITPLPYRRIDLRGDDVMERFRRAADDGDASFACVGLNPDFFSERLTATMTGLSNDITRIHLREYFRMDGSVGDEMLSVVGFGAAIDDGDAGLLLASLARSYDVPSMVTLAERLGRPIERVEVTNKSVAAPRLIEYRDLRVETGAVGMLGICFDGYVEGAPFITFENYYYLTEVMRPSGAAGDEYWTLTIEGRPSLRVTVEAMASVEHGTTRYDGDPTTPGYYATIVAMIQAVPGVMAAPPGILDPLLPPVHWHSDLRDGAVSPLSTSGARG